MSLGLGIALLLIGLILALQIINFPQGFDNIISEQSQQTLGWIFVVVAVLAIGLSLYLYNQSRERRTVVEDRRDPRNPPR